MGQVLVAPHPFFLNWAHLGHLGLTPGASACLPHALPASVRHLPTSLVLHLAQWVLELAWPVL